MKKVIIYFCFSFSITIVVYLIISFVNWDILCFLKIPKMDWFCRLIIACIYVFKEIFVNMAFNDFIKPKIK